MSSTKPRYAKLVYQLAPAALVSAVGIALLSSLAKPVSAPPQATPAATAIDAEAVFTPTPRPAEAAQPAKPATSMASRLAEKPKPQAYKLTPNELPAPQAESTPALPLPITPPSPPQMEAAAQGNSNPTVMDRVRGATAAVASMPQRAYGKVTGWFAYDPPPRPPADVPSQDFTKAAM